VPDNLKLHELKQRLQAHLSDGLLLVVGSGLSVAEGLPSMGRLEEILKSEIPKSIDAKDQANWEQVIKQFDAGRGLEGALQDVKVSEELETLIRAVVAQHIEQSERQTIQECFSKSRSLRMAQLLPHLNPEPNKPLPIVTTNYDRLIEVAAEIAGYGVDTMFCGNFAANLDAELSRKSFVKSVARGKKLKIEYRKRISLFKPHGSLGWYALNGSPIQCHIPLELPPYIITPGLAKYRRGYDAPFDAQREGANQAIDSAARFFVVGYGFNDDHLETHLSPQIKKGKPCLILTHGLTPNAQAIVEQSPNTLAVVADTGGFKTISPTGHDHFSGLELWDIATFVREVLEP
jgi:hypothetical protein